MVLKYAGALTLVADCAIFTMHVNLHFDWFYPSEMQSRAGKLRYGHVQTGDLRVPAGASMAMISHVLCVLTIPVTYALLLHIL